MVFGDISKAFDKVWHAGLLFKLKNMGITEELLTWISNYLCDRKQRVVLQGESSCWTDINAGVPQSFVLGPLLFLVYINDMEEGLTSKLTLFADDNLLLSISNCHIINFANTEQRPRKTRSAGATMDCQLQRFKNKQYGG